MGVALQQAAHGKFILRGPAGCAAARERGGGGGGVTMGKAVTELTSRQARDVAAAAKSSRAAAAADAWQRREGEAPPLASTCETEPNSVVICLCVRGTWTPSTVKKRERTIQIFTEIRQFVVKTAVVSDHGLKKYSPIMTQQKSWRAGAGGTLQAAGLLFSIISTENL